MSVHCSEMFRPFEPGQQVLIDLSGAQREDKAFLLFVLGDKIGGWKFLLSYPEAAIRVLVRSSPSCPAEILSWNRRLHDYQSDHRFKYLPVVRLRDFCCEEPPLAQPAPDFLALL